jgi:hypothetical protein
MQIPVLIEQVSGNAYRASGGEPLKLAAEGATRAEALQKLQTLIRDRMAAGAEIVPLSVDNTGHPWDDFVGTWDENDPVIQEWEKAVAEYRRQVEADPNIP